MLNTGTLDRKKLQEFATELAKGIKTEADLNAFTQELMKLTIETALRAELTEHLGYDKHERVKGRNNSRNGHSSKVVKSKQGEVELDIPRDREGSFEPQIIKKHQSRVTQIDEQILSLYAKGMSVREIADTFKELYDTDVSPSLISRVTDQVHERILEWQSRPLDALYAIVYLDCIVLKVRQDMRVINKAFYLALGITMEGKKELMGLWVSENEGAKFWLSVMTELRSRGVADILIACVDGLKGFPEAINAEYPETPIQLCMVHMVRNSMRYVSWQDYKAVAAALKAIYQAPTEELAKHALAQFEQAWGETYPQIGKSWQNNWDNLRTIFDYPPDIRKAIYTTNAIESLNSVIRTATRNRKVFPSDDAAKKVVFLTIDRASRKWTMPIQNWRKALNHFTIAFEERVTKHLH